MLHVSGQNNYVFPIHRYFQQDFLKEKHGVSGTPKFGNIEYKHEIWPADLRKESRNWQVAAFFWRSFLEIPTCIG